MIAGLYSRFGKSPMDAYRASAARQIQPIPPVKPLPPLDVPVAPGLSSRISPGTVPMKKGMR